MSNILNEDIGIKNNAKIKFTLAQKIQFLCIVYVAIWTISPVLAYGMVYRILAIGCVFLWFILVFMSTKKFKKDIFLSLLYIVFTGTINFLLHDIDGLLRNFQVYIFIFFFIVYLHYSKLGLLHIKPILIPLIGLFTIWNITTLNGYEELGNASRMLSKSFDGANELMNEGIGGFGHIYSQIILVPSVLYLLQKRIYKNIWYNLLFAIYIIVTITLILNAGFSLAIINLILTMFLYFLIKNKNWVNIFKLCSVGFIISIIIYLNFEIIFNFLISLASGTRYQLKVIDIYSSLRGVTSLGTVEVRLERYIRSIKLFFQNPLIGQLSYSELGKHSALIDSFAQYGIFMGLIFMKIVLGTPYKFLKNSVGSKFKLSSVVLVSLIISAGTNNIPAQLGVSLFIIYPLIWNLSTKDNGGLKYDSQ